MNIRQQETKITAFYERLSCDDEQSSEFNFITLQKKMLENYAGKNSFANPVHFSTTSTETMSDKIKRMLRNEVSQI